MFAFQALLTLVGAASVFAHPMHHHHEARDWRIIGRDVSVKVSRETASLDVLSQGNQAFRDTLAKDEPQLLKKLADEGQSPPFMFLGCSDSRVSEGTIFNAKPGTLFTQRNIANQFQRNDANAQSVLAYAVAELGVEHVIVMGHYGCGGVAASIASAPTAQVDAANGAVQSWIQPIRELFLSSTRPEISELRSKLSSQATVEEPDIKEPGFRALVEENVKAGVARIASDSIIVNHYALLAANGTAVKRRAEGGAPKDVFVHGFVYDIETGIIADLKVSVGPPGKAIPAIPFSAVAKAADAVSSTPSSSATSTSTSSNASGGTSTAPAVTTSTIKSAAPAPSAGGVKIDATVSANEAIAVAVASPPATVKVDAVLA